MLVADGSRVERARFAGADGFHAVNEAPAEIFCGERAEAIFLFAEGLLRNVGRRGIVAQNAFVGLGPAEELLVRRGVADLDALQVGLGRGVNRDETAALLVDAAGAVAHDEATIMHGEGGAVL